MQRRTQNGVLVGGVLVVAAALFFGAHTVTDTIRHPPPILVWITCSIISTYRLNSTISPHTGTDR